MHSHADKNRESKEQSTAANIRNEENQNASAFQFEDNRPEVLQRQQFQKMTPRHDKKNSFQFVDNRPKKLVQRKLQEKTKRKSLSKQSPIQRVLSNSAKNYFEEQTGKNFDLNDFIEDLEVTFGELSEQEKKKVREMEEDSTKKYSIANVHEEILKLRKQISRNDMAKLLFKGVEEHTFEQFKEKTGEVHEFPNDFHTWQNRLTTGGAMSGYLPSTPNLKFVKSDNIVKPVGNQNVRIHGTGYFVQPGGNTRSDEVFEPKDTYREAIPALLNMHKDFESTTKSKTFSQDKLSEPELATTLLKYMGKGFDFSTLPRNQFTEQIGKLITIYDIAEVARNPASAEFIRAILKKIALGKLTFQQGFYQGDKGADSVFLGAKSDGGAEQLKKPSHNADARYRQMMLENDTSKKDQQIDDPAIFFNDQLNFFHEASPFVDFKEPEKLSEEEIWDLEIIKFEEEYENLVEAASTFDNEDSRILKEEIGYQQNRLFAISNPQIAPLQHQFLQLRAKYNPVLQKMKKQKKNKEIDKKIQRITKLMQKTEKSSNKYFFLYEKLKKLHANSINSKVSISNQSKKIKKEDQSKTKEKKKKK